MSAEGMDDLRPTARAQLSAGASSQAQATTTGGDGGKASLSTPSQAVGASIGVRSADFSDTASPTEVASPLSASGEDASGDTARGVTRWVGGFGEVGKWSWFPFS
jgi:hypothetical protein